MTIDTEITVTATESKKADEDFTASDEEVLSISKQLMEQNKEAYEVLAK